jgi:hypothetical protein
MYYLNWWSYMVLHIRTAHSPQNIIKNQSAQSSISLDCHQCCVHTIHTLSSTNSYLLKYT